MRLPHVSVIIPTLNEEAAIGKVLESLPMDVVDEVILVDSSSDGTPKVAEDMGFRVVRELRKGYGRALHTGIEYARGDVVVYVDGDFSYDPKEIPHLVQPILNEKCDVVLGNRLNGHMHPGAMDSLNRFGNHALSLILSFVFRRRISDTQCGMRAIRKRLLAGLRYRDYGMPYVTEQLIKLIIRGAKVSEAPISYRPRIGSTKLCPWKDGMKILRTILGAVARRQ